VGSGPTSPRSIVSTLESGGSMILSQEYSCTLILLSVLSYISTYACQYLIYFVSLQPSTKIILANAYTVCINTVPKYLYIVLPCARFISSSSQCIFCQLMRYYCS
jgi:hypothetical protein